MADTPEVTAAKQAFAAAYNEAARAAAAASPYAAAHQAAPEAEAPAAVPYQHVEVPAEPYVHIEPQYDLLGNVIGQASAAPVAPAAPVYNNNPVYQQYQAYQPAQPVQPAASAYNLAYAEGNAVGGCYNWRGEGVPCRTNFNQ